MAKKKKESARNTEQKIDTDINEDRMEERIIKVLPKKEGGIEEETAEENEGDFFEDELGGDGFSSPGSVGFNRTSAPVLESTNSDQQFSELEDQMQNIPKSMSAGGEQNEKFSYIKNAPDYSGSDYSRAVYDVMAGEGMNMNVDRQRDITAATTMHRQPIIEEQREMNLRRWQAENVWSGEGGSERRAPGTERDYQVSGKHELRRKDKLPFQE